VSEPINGVMVGSGSNPLTVRRTIMYVAQMNLYKTIRQKIEKLPPTSSVKDVLKLWMNASRKNQRE
jgi:hypothetical protein